MVASRALCSHGHVGSSLLCSCDRSGGGTRAVPASPGKGGGLSIGRGGGESCNAAECHRDRKKRMPGNLHASAGEGMRTATQKQGQAPAGSNTVWPCTARQAIGLCTATES